MKNLLKTITEFIWLRAVIFCGLFEIRSSSTTIKCLYPGYGSKDRLILDHRKFNIGVRGFTLKTGKLLWAER
jgi:hypothetical protein